MAEPRMVTCDLCQQPREAGFPHTNTQCINALLARVRELEAELEQANLDKAAAIVTANELRQVQVVSTANAGDVALASGHFISLAEREGAAVVKLEHLEKIRWQRVAIGAKRNGSLVYVTRCLGCGCSKSTEDGPDCWIAAAIRAAGGER